MFGVLFSKYCLCLKNFIFMVNIIIDFRFSPIIDRNPGSSIINLNYILAKKQFFFKITIVRFNIVLPTSLPVGLLQQITTGSSFESCLRITTFREVVMKDWR